MSKYNSESFFIVANGSDKRSKFLTIKTQYDGYK